MNLLRYLKIILVLAWCAGINRLSAQQNTGVLKTDKAGSVKVSGIEQDYAPGIIHLSDPKPVSPPRKFPEPVRYPNPKSIYNVNRSDTLAPPTVIKGFEAIANDNGYPNDNDLAISNNGVIISVVNSQIHFYDESGAQLKKLSLDAFYDTLGLSGGTYDPRIVYDEAEDRFIAVFLSGSAASNSHVIIAFSATADPLDLWHFYKIPGNLLGDTTWADFPMIAISEDELFINISNYDDDAGFFDFVYYGTRIIQARKSDGYTGDSLTYVYHYNFPFETDLPWDNDYMQLTPVRGAREPYGPHMYFLGLYDAHSQSDTMYLVEITNTIDHPLATVHSTLLQTDVPYIQVPEAQQPGNHKLLTNYNTILNAFYLDGDIQFVRNHPSPLDGRSVIYHGFVTDAGQSNQATATLIVDDSLELGYPHLIYAGEDPSDDAAMIFFNYTSDKRYPGNGALFYQDGKYSSLVTLKEGHASMDFSGDIAERWGDYTGGQLKYNEPGKVWVAGSYGTSAGFSETWISGLDVADQLIVVSAADPSPQPTKQLTLYPNPAYQWLTLEFDASDNSLHRFELYDMTGHRLLMEDRVKPGRNRFQMNIAGLSPGAYIVKVNTDAGPVGQKKFVVHH